MDAAQETHTVENSQGFDFKSVVEESKERLHSAELKDAPPIITRRRGRPAGTYGKYKKTKANAAQVETATELKHEPAPMRTPPPDISEVLKGPLKVLSGIPARKYSCPELALDDTEAAALAEAANNLAGLYFPDLEKMDPKTAAWFNFSLVSITIFVTKMQIYAAHQQKIERENAELNLKQDAENNKTVELNLNKNNEPKINSDDYFKVNRQ